MINNTPDFYSLLSIPQNATPKEIKDAYREQAKKNHPDLLKDLPDAEKRERIESMYQINEAYEALSDPQRKKQYDSGSYTRSGGERGSAPRTEEEEWRLYEDFFRRASERFESGDFTTPVSEDLELNFLFKEQWEKKYFIIPESDLGLLAALRRAYQSKEDGEWRVRKPTNDTRNWMPEEIWSVRRNGDQVRVSRIIKDWRLPRDRNKPIQISKKRKLWQPREIIETVGPDTLLDEYYFDKGADEIGLNSESGNVPNFFAEYVEALKSIAGGPKVLRERSRGGLGDLLGVQDIINLHGAEYLKGHVSLDAEGKNIFREFARKIPVETGGAWNFRQNLELIMTEVDSLVHQVEGTHIPIEGQRRLPEG